MRETFNVFVKHNRTVDDPDLSIRHHQQFIVHSGLSRINQQWWTINIHNIKIWTVNCSGPDPSTVDGQLWTVRI